MLRLTLPCPESGHVMYVVADEVGGQHVGRCAPHTLAAEEEDSVWDELEGSLAERVREELVRAPKHYRGLRGTTVIGSWRTSKDLLQLRSGVDTMTVDLDLALALRKALTDYLNGRQSESTVVDLTPYRCIITLDALGGVMTVWSGSYSTSEVVSPKGVDLYLREPEQRMSAIQRLLHKIKRSMGEEPVQVKILNGARPTTPLD